MGKIPWRRKWQPTPVFLLGKFHGQRSLAGYSPRSHKESDTTKQLSRHTCMGFWSIRFQPVHKAAASARDLVRSYYTRNMVWGNWPPRGRYWCSLLSTTVFRLPLNTYTHTHTCTHARMHACTHVCVRAHTHTHTRTHTHCLS